MIPNRVRSQCVLAVAFVALVAFGATAKHCAFFPMSDTIVAQFEDELEGFDTSKGTIRFQPERPLPAALVKRIVKARLAENAARATKTKSKSKSKKSR